MDKIQKFLAYNGKINITCVETTNLVEEARKLHDLSPVATAVLGRVLTMGALMASAFKDKDDSVTLQIRANGPIGGVTVTAEADGRVRGYVTNPQVEVPLRKDGKLNVGEAVGHDGFLYVIKRHRTKRTIYRNVKTNIRGNSRRLCKLLLHIRTKKYSSSFRSSSK